ncbi:MAG: hypothetical protein GY861_01885 [bacterium]|nr:hypothetical protein [bacterium]
MDTPDSIGPYRLFKPEDVEVGMTYLVKNNWQDIPWMVPGGVAPTRVTSVDEKCFSYLNSNWMVTGVQKFSNPLQGILVKEGESGIELLVSAVFLKHLSSVYETTS